MRLRQCSCIVLDVLDDLSQDHGVEHGVGEGKLRRVRFDDGAARARSSRTATAAGDRSVLVTSKPASTRRFVNVP